MIGIINYGLGNIKAFLNVYERLGIPSKLINNLDDFKNITKLILPGVGSFDYAMNQLNSSGLREQLETTVLKEKIPVLGICVGMQMLAESSEEGKLQGLGWIPGNVKKLNLTNIPYKTKLPHMGWNTIRVINTNILLQDLDSTSRFYFLHSYYFECNDQANISASTTYGNDFACAISKSNIFGVQFHPEKSHQNGIKLLKNFANLC